MLGPGVGTSVEISPASEQDQVWLRLRQLAEHNRALDTHDRLVAHAPKEPVSQTVDTCLVPPANRGHIGDLSIEQFHACVLGQNAGLGHAVVVGHRERMSDRRERHRPTSPSSFILAQTKAPEPSRRYGSGALHLGRDFFGLPGRFLPLVGERYSAYTPGPAAVSPNLLAHRTPDP